MTIIRRMDGSKKKANANFRRMDESRKNAYAVPAGCREIPAGKCRTSAGWTETRRRPTQFPPDGSEYINKALNTRIYDPGRAQSLQDLRPNKRKTGQSGRFNENGDRQNQRFYATRCSAFTKSLPLSGGGMGLPS
jgi:hypothetical protein